ncbi:hypothetical protein [Streptomyces sp. CAU 1734]|uniref:hypothetical protein n=1 Tax=Streptomyces sp. CAU 1734 TaxID=3140360 RepID=UPI003260A2E4
MSVDLMNILRRLDDPAGLEFPDGYSRAEADASFDRLIEQIESRFSVNCEIDRDIQDSAQYGRIDVPEEATVRGMRIVFLVSKFKPLAMIAADNPGAFLGTDEARAEGALDLADLGKAEQALVESGYVVIPEELLTTRYDGVARLVFHGSGEPDWWDRFFGSF